jgi:hypothetical protein
VSVAACASAVSASLSVEAEDNDEDRELGTTSSAADAADREAVRPTPHAIYNNRNPIPTTSRRSSESKPIHPATDRLRNR